MLDKEKFLQNLSQFKNYWELYSFVAQITPNRVEFNVLMWEARNVYLQLLPTLHTSTN
jgi:hypothetical protein